MVELLKLMGVLLAVAASLLGPSIYYIRTMAAKTDQKNEQLIKDISSRQEKTLDRIEKQQSDSITAIKMDFKEFRVHLDSRFADVMETVDTKVGALETRIGKDLDSLKNHYKTIELRIESHNEKSHGIEKDILRLQNTLSKDYITKDQLDVILQLRNR